RDQLRDEGRAVHRQTRQLLLDAPRELGPGLFADRGQSVRQALALGPRLLELGLSGVERDLGDGEPVTLGAAALGVLQHRGDAAAVLAHQALVRIETLLDDLA